MAPQSGPSRRQFVKGTGLLIGFSMADVAVLPHVLGAAGQPATTTPSPGRLDAWLRIQPDGQIVVYTGKAEIGMGVETAYIQIVAEELDVPVDRVSVVMGDTSATPDQGGVGGSTSVLGGGKPIRNAAATARYLLLQIASRHLGMAPEFLVVRDGIVQVKGDETQKVSYTELATSTDFTEVLKITGQGSGLNVEGSGKPKDPSSYSVVGSSVPRVDMPPKVFGTYQYVTDVRVPKMVHGRVIRPAGVGSKLVSVDESAVKSIQGYLQTVTKGNFVGVVAETEWAAVRAAKALKVTWTPPLAQFPEQKNLYQDMRRTTPKLSRETLKKGDVTTALASATRRLEATYEFPFQSHASMGPGCAVADVQMGGVTTVWSGAQKMHALQRGLAELLNVSSDKVRVIWVADSGSYGRCGYEDTAADAVLLSQAVGRPVRVQWSRADMTAWGPKGPPVLVDFVAGLDDNGGVSALQYVSRAHSGQEIASSPSTAGNMLASQLIGIENSGRGNEMAEWGVMALPYAFPNVLATAHMLPAYNDLASPLRTAHLRDPNGPPTTFAVESFIDELAAALGVDPLEFRLKYQENARARAVLSGAAEKAGWERRPSPGKNTATGDIVTGRGIAVGTRRDTYVGTVAEVEVNRKTGVVRVTRFVCCHDCGLIINPGAVEATVAANLIQSMSRSLKEEIMFDRSNVTSVDWATYQVARSTDVPKIEIVLLKNQSIPPGGVGETSSRPTVAAIANAIFDATGARVRQAPFTPARVKTALAEVKPA